MTLLDGQYQYNGLLLGAGTPFRLASLTGLEDLNARSGDQPLPRGQGSVPGPHYASAKDIVAQLRVTDGDQSIADSLAQLRAAFTISPDPQPLTFKRAGLPERFINVAPIQVQNAEKVPTVGVVASPKVALTAADPRIYSSASRQIVVGKYDPSGGRLDYPGDWPKDFPAGGGGEGVAENAGGSDAYPLLRFYGPTDGGTVTSVTIRNITTGQAMTITTSLGAGQILTVDNLAHVTGSGKQVVGIGGTSRYGSWQQPRVPFALPPGESTLRYTTEGTSTATVCVVTWQDTWLS